MVRVLWMGLVGLIVGSVIPVHAQSPAGRIKSVSGSAFVIRNGAEILAKIGDLVLESDGLKTGADGRLALTLKDETRLSLGPDTEARLDRFIYAPSAGRLGFTLSVVRGLLAYVSGRIAKLAPDAVRLETPSAIIGVRGTRLAIRVEHP
jgi:hypothetical protein